MSSASKVGEIFTAAGLAFSKLGELTMQLHPGSEPPPSSGKWTDEEIHMLHTAINNFGQDLKKISETIKNKTITQIRNQLKKTAFEKAGLPAPLPETIPSVSSSGSEKSPKKREASGKSSRPSAKKQKSSSDVTLNALNTVEGEVDIETIGETATVKKLEFDSEVEETVVEDGVIL